MQRLRWWKVCCDFGLKYLHELRCRDLRSVGSQRLHHLRSRDIAKQQWDGCLLQLFCRALLAKFVVVCLRILLGRRL